MTDIDAVAEAIARAEVDWFEDKRLSYGKRFQVLAQAAVDALQLTEETDELLVPDPGKICAKFRRFVGPWVLDE